MARIPGLLVGLLSLSAFLAPASAADMSFIHKSRVANACPRAWICNGDRCGWSHSCMPQGCPDGYGCYPLYGGYGPWGGLAYSDSFSFKN